MTSHALRHCRILIVEDEYILADELQMELEDAAATIIGPAGTVADAIRLVGTEQRIDGAILDVNLRGELVFPVADRLAERGVPILFTTGYDETVIPHRFAAIGRYQKPMNIGRLMRAIEDVIHG